MDSLITKLNPNTSIIAKFSFFIFLLFLISCEKGKIIMDNDDLVNSIDTSDPIYQEILKIGFNKEHIVATEHAYIVEGDILFRKNLHVRYYSAKEGRVDQYHTCNLSKRPDYQTSFLINLSNVVDVRTVLEALTKYLFCNR